jgi:hypothetical protein
MSELMDPCSDLLKLPIYSWAGVKINASNLMAQQYNAATSGYKYSNIAILVKWLKNALKTALFGAVVLADTIAAWRKLIGIKR